MDVNLGSAQLKKSFFPDSFDSSTTANFGECIPQFCKDVAPNTHVSVDMRSGVRLAPLSLPTFGKAYLKSYFFYNRISDLYPPFDNLLTQTTFTSGNGVSYIPDSVPNLPLSCLWAMVLSNSIVSYYKLDSAASLNEGVLSYTRYTLTPLDFGVLNIPAHIKDGMLDPCSDFIFAQRGLSSSFIKNLETNVPNSSYPFGNFSRIQLDDSPGGLVEPGSADFLVRCKYANAHYFDGTKFVKYDLTVPGSATEYVIAVRLTDSGKFLRKLLLGLGYKIGNYSSVVSMLPLFAYYFNYFDTFAPKRFLQRIDTSAYKLLNYCVQTGRDLLDRWYIGDTTFGSSLNLGSEFVDELCGCFYTEDTDYYTSQIIGQISDFGSYIDQPYLGYDSEDGLDKVLVATGSPSSSATGYFNFSSSSVSEGSDFANAHQQSQQNILSRLTEFLNIRSLVGGELAETLKAVYGVDVKDVLDMHRTYVGSSSVDVEFSDVFSTAETQQGSLGEYAGKALGFGQNGQLSFDCPVEGFFMCFSTIVPRTQYVDGVNPCRFHVKGTDFYNPKFDGLTLLPTRALSFFGHDTSYYGTTSSNADNHSFGNAPIYQEYKTKTQGVLNGDLSLRSTQASYDSFTMDRCIANEPYFVIQSSPSAPYNVEFVDANISQLTCGTSWRYLGRWLWYGRFDRIFVNAREVFSTYTKESWETFFNSFVTRQSFRTDDNLIVHNIVDLKLNSAMLPVADSYMTKDLYELENGKGVRAKGQ